MTIGRYAADEGKLNRPTILCFGTLHLIPGERVAQTGRQVLVACSPVTLLPSKRQLERHSSGKKFMSDPTLVMGLPIELGALDVDVLVSGIEIDVSKWWLSDWFPGWWFQPPRRTVG